MNDFLDHASAACPSQFELLMWERDEAKARVKPLVADTINLRFEAVQLRKERDDARAEADRLKGELGRLGKERDDLAEKLKAEAARSRAGQPDGKPGPANAESLYGLREIRTIIAKPVNGIPDDAGHRLANIALIVGRLIAAAR